MRNSRVLGLGSPIPAIYRISPSATPTHNNKLAILPPTLTSTTLPPTVPHTHTTTATTTTATTTMSVYSSDGYFSDSSLDPSDSDPDTHLPDAPVHSASDDPDVDSDDSDDASDDASPSYDSSYSTPSSNAATTTIASLVTNYKFEHGRRYHSYSEGAYFAPNDSQQNNQLEIFHHIHRLLLDSRLFTSPLTPEQLGGSKVLDLGTGTGCWAIEFADIFPHVQVLGNDLSPVQPTWVPGNCTFEVDDFTKPWLHGQAVFSLIFARSIAGCVRDWKLLLAEARGSLAPGGWFESVEATVEFWDRRYEGGELPEGSKLAKLAREAREAAERGGRGFGCVGGVKKGLEEAGFVDVEETVWELPVGGWMEVCCETQNSYSNSASLFEEWRSCGTCTDRV